MKLSEWLSTNQKTDAWLAAKIGKERSVVTKLKNGGRSTTLATLLRIEEATGGDVKPNDFMPTKVGAAAQGVAE